MTHLARNRIVASNPPTLRVHGVTLEELFEEAGYAVFDQGHRLEEIPATYSRPVIAAGDSPGELLAAWIDELLAMSEGARIIPSYFVVDRLETGGVQGSAAGLPVAEVSRQGRAVTGLAGPLPSPVRIPDGWWVDLAVRLEPAVRSI